MILVAGATGELGTLITRTLLRHGEPVRVLVRNGSSYDHLVEAGALPVIGDLKDADSLRAACASVDSVVTTANSTARDGGDTVESVDLQGNFNLVSAAAAAGVRNFVFTSAFGAHTENPMPLLQAKGETEQLLKNTGMRWTILQPNVFMDKLIPAVVGGPALAGRPVTLIGSGERHHSFVAMCDVAAYAVAALERAQPEGRTLVVGGPLPVSWLDIVATHEQELGRSIPVRTVPLGQRLPDLPDIVSHLVTALETYDSPIDIDELASSYRVTPTPLVEFVRGFLASHRQPIG
jgi:NADH dehydrogenase